MLPLELAKKDGNEHASSCLSWLRSLFEVGGDRTFLFLNFPLSSKRTEGWGPREGPPAFHNQAGGDVEISGAGNKILELLDQVPMLLFNP